MSSLIDNTMTNEYRAKNEEDEDLVEDKKDFSEHAFVCSLTLKEELIGDNTRVVVVNRGAPQSLMKILLQSTWVEAGKIETTYHEKTQDSLTFYSVKAHNLMLIFIEGTMESQFCGQIISKLWPVLSAKKCSYIGLQTVYKTNYSTFDGHFSVDADRALPIRFSRSSNSSALVEVLMSQNKYAEHIVADNQLNPVGGMTAALMMHSEMYGQAAMNVKVVIDQHFVTTETL